jgi:glycosyltransferase involved in cell wall biosynthesis
MKVLQLISSSGYYGAEAVMVSLSKHLNKLGIPSTVGVFDNAQHPNLEVAEVARQQGSPVEVVRCQGRADWGAVQTIREFVRRERIDIIHTHGYKAHLYGYLAARVLPCSLIATCHGYHSIVPARIARCRQQLYSSVERALLRRFDQVVAVSSDLALFLKQKGVRLDKLAVIENGVDLDQFGSAPPSADLNAAKAGRLAIGLVGRLTEGKGHSQFFDAAREFLLQHKDTLLVVIGDGPLEQPLEMLARELGIETSIIFTGKRSDMAEVYAALDILVLPSLHEGMPMVILEALAARVAVIATRVGAIPHVILPGQTGLLVEPGDAVGLREAICQLLIDAKLRRSLGEGGCRFVGEHFSALAMAGKYLNLYQMAVR